MPDRPAAFGQHCRQRQGFLRGRAALQPPLFTIICPQWMQLPNQKKKRYFANRMSAPEQRNAHCSTAASLSTCVPSLSAWTEPPNVPFLPLCQKPGKPTMTVLLPESWGAHTAVTALSTHRLPKINSKGSEAGHPSYQQIKEVGGPPCPRHCLWVSVWSQKPTEPIKA